MSKVETDVATKKSFEYTDILSWNFYSSFRKKTPGYSRVRDFYHRTSLRVCVSHLTP